MVTEAVGNGFDSDAVSQRRHDSKTRAVKYLSAHTIDVSRCDLCG